MDETAKFSTKARFKTDLEKMIEHLKEQDLGYFQHWWRAMKISGALFIHAFLPDVLSDYASKEICDD